MNNKIESVFNTASKINILVIENANAYAQFIDEMRNQMAGGAGGFRVYKGEQEVSLSQIIELIFSPWSIETNATKHLNKLYKEMGRWAYSEENLGRTERIKGEVVKYLDDLVFASMIDLEFEEDFDIVGLFKAAKLRFLDSGDKSIVERLINFMLAIRNCDGDKLFIFINLKSFIGEDDLREFYKMVLNKRLDILMLENIAREKREGENVVIIDENLCEILG